MEKLRKRWSVCSNLLAIACLSAVTLLAQSAQATDYYIAPNGNSAASGSITSPWDIATGLQKASLVKGGDTVWLRGGTYGTGGSLVYSCTLKGTGPSTPVIVRQYRGERATVNGAIKISGAYVWLWGFEVTNTSTVRSVTNIDTQRPRGILIGTAAVGTKIINMAVHDVGRSGIGGGTNNYEIYGTLLWGNGIYDLGSGSGTSFPRGDAAYLNLWQGTPSSTAVNYLRDNIAFRNFYGGFKVYTEWSNVNIDGYDLEGNISFDNANRLGGYHEQGNMLVSSRLVGPPIKRLKLINNFAYRTAASTNPYNSEFGCQQGSGTRCEDVVIKDNTFVAGTTSLGAFRAMNWNNAQVTGNTALAASGTVTNWIREFTPLSIQWDQNRYYKGSSSAFKVTSTSYSFPTWKSVTGSDAASTYSTTRPTGAKVMVRKNIYEPGERANIAIYNPDLLSSVAVDLTSAGFADGTNFELVDAQNYFGPAVLTGTFHTASPTISVPMNLTAVTPLVGSVPHLTNTNTAPEFGAFILRKR